MGRYVDHPGVVVPDIAFKGEYFGLSHVLRNFIITQQFTATWQSYIGGWASSKSPVAFWIPLSIQFLQDWCNSSGGRWPRVWNVKKVQTTVRGNHASSTRESLTFPFQSDICSQGHQWWGSWATSSCLPNLCKVYYCRRRFDSWAFCL